MCTKVKCNTRLNVSITTSFQVCWLVSLQRMHFNEYMPRVFSDLQQMDERRITCIQNFMKEVAQAQLKVNPIVLKCLNEIIAAADKIDPVKDSEMVVDKYKSGFFPPDDFPFETLSEEKTNGASLNYSSGGPHHKKETQRGTISSKIKKRTLLSTIFGPSNKVHSEYNEYNSVNSQTIGCSR